MYTIMYQQIKITRGIVNGQLVSNNNERIVNLLMYLCYTHKLLLQIYN